MGRRQGNLAPAQFQFSQEVPIHRFQAGHGGGNVGAPQRHALRAAGTGEVQLVCKAAGEGLVQTLGPIGGGHEQASEALEELQQEILHAREHAIHTVPAIHAASQQLVRLIEQQDGHLRTAPTGLLISFEQGAQALLTFAHILVKNAGAVRYQKGTPQARRQGLGRQAFARAGRSAEQEQPATGPRAHMATGHTPRFKSGAQALATMGGNKIQLLGQAGRQHQTLPLNPAFLQLKDVLALQQGLQGRFLMLAQYFQGAIAHLHHAAKGAALQ